MRVNPIFPNLVLTILFYQKVCVSVELCSVLHDGDNLSDHDVVSLKLAISVTHKTLDVRMIDKLLWRQATTPELIKYQNNLDRLLCKCDIPDHVLQCDDVFCDVHQHFYTRIS